MNSGEVTHTMLEVSGLEHEFDGVAAVADISFSVRKGAIVALIGPNGAGKSTVVDVVSGTKKLQRGTIRFDGINISGWSPHRIANAGLVRTFQVSTGFARLTTLENMLVVASGDQLRGLPGWLFRPRAISGWERSAVAAAMKILDDFSLGDKGQTYAEELSGGQRRLLEIARLMAMHPECVLLDEPTAGVSPVLVDVLVDRIKALRDQGITVVVVEHNLDVVERLCDEVIVMAEGKLLSRGTLAEMRTVEEVVNAYLG